ncbi:MAG: hypothetical protein HDQ96_04825 [Lachnospiraceae bacterium]|nr:hypothetical protein [Lachnospiraceae bacterium]
MLGKTNITALSESATVTEIEDYKWIQIQTGIYSDFKKVIYQNGYLAAITADGIIAYTTDGEVWQTHVLEYEDCKLNDIDWDGSRFILVGSHKGINPFGDGTGELVQRGLIVVTSNFDTYEVKDVESTTGYAREYFLVYPTNGKYIVIASVNTAPGSSYNIKTYEYLGNLEEKWDSEKQKSFFTHSMAKNSKDIIVFHEENYVGGSSYYIERINGSDGEVYSYTNVKVSESTKAFECKDELYAMLFNGKYSLYKLTNSDECMLMSSEKNFAFVDGVYFDNCQIFINSHEMLVVKKGELISDKTVDDLIEIAPELTMNCITKAFGQLYIFGNHGVILKSSVETNNEEAITVQALSAKKALLEAKEYTDERYTDFINLVGTMKPFTKDVDVNLNGTNDVRVLDLDGTEECGWYTEDSIKFITAIAIGRGAELSSPTIAKFPNDNFPGIYIFSPKNLTGPCKIRIHIE